MKTLISTAIALAMASTCASAQVMTLSTTNPGGLSHSIGSAIAKTVSESTDIRMVVVPAGGSPMPPVTGGESDCGINTAYDVAYYVNATNYYSGDPKHENLRIAGAVLPSAVAMYVKTDSDITNPPDLKGKRVPGGLNAQLAIGAIYETYLDLAGLTRDDVQTVAAQSIVQAADDFAAGRNDTFVFSVGTAKVLEVDSSVGGLRALTVEDSPETRETLGNNLPGAYFTALEAGFAPQIKATTNVITFDLVLFCADTVADDKVASIVKAIHDNKDKLVENFKAMGRFDPQKMSPDVPGVQYHPGATRYYKEAGMN